MSDKSYSPVGKDNILMSNVMLFNGTECYEFHVGGLITFNEFVKREDFWEYLKANVSKEITLEIYGYCLHGATGVTRDATDEEMETVIDNGFPNNPIYSAYLSNEENEDHKDVFVLKPMTHYSLKDRIQVLYRCRDFDEEFHLLYEEQIRDGELEDQSSHIQAM